MRVIRNGETEEERVLALGTFDGVHRGHQALLEAGKQYAREHGIRLRACSFDRHPLEVLRPETAPKLLTTLPEKAGLMARYGADELQLLRFTREIGKGGTGNAALLRMDGNRYGYDVIIVPPVTTKEGEAVSSTLIRRRLQEGLAEEAEALMGHPYELRGRVTDGKHVGRRIGVPTANVRTGARKQLPAFGVYPCRMITAEGTCPAAVNIGVQPTLPSGKVTVEAHVLEGEPELYGKCVRLIPGDRIRPEQKFENAEALTAQIRKDQEAVREWYEKTSLSAR